MFGYAIGSVGDLNQDSLSGEFFFSLETSYFTSANKYLKSRIFGIFINLITVSKTRNRFLSMKVFAY